MRRCRGTVAALALAQTAAFGQDQADKAIEPLPADTLSGKAVVVPRDLTPQAVLVVGFSRASNEQTMAWRQRIDQCANESRPDASPLAAACSRLSLYGVVVLANAPRWVRGLVTRMIRRTVPKEEHERVFVVKEQADAWRSLAAAGDEDAAYVVRLDAGRVCFRHEGPATDAALAALLDAPCGGASPGP